jgi:DNA polymerase III epsilon subunit-like protein
MSQLFIFDTETTSLKEPTIIQFAYIISDDDGNIIEEYDKYWNTIQPISKISQSIHNINEDFLIQNGVDPIPELQLIFKKMENCRKIIAHNTEFDTKAINWTRKGLGLDFIDFNNTFCTMRRSKYFVGIYNDKGWIKWPKLIELYNFLGGEVDENKLHNAMEDVKVLKECYFLAKKKEFW